MTLKTTISVIAVAAISLLNGAQLLNDSSFSLSDLPPELTANCPVGKDISFSIEENCKGGFSWQLLPQTNCEVSLKHKPARGKSSSIPGRVEIEIEPQRSGAMILQFIYFDTINKRTVKKLIVKINHGAATISPSNDRSVPAVSLKKLINDAVYRLSDLQAVNKCRAVLPVGGEIEFKLEEDRPAAYWEISKYDSNLFRIKFDSDDDGVWPFRFDTKEIEIKSIARGRGQVELIYRTSDRIIKRFVCYIEVI